MMRFVILLSLLLFVDPVISTNGVILPMDIFNQRHLKKHRELIGSFPHYPCYNPVHFNPDYLATIIGHWHQEASSLPLKRVTPYYEKYFGPGVIHKDMHFYTDCPKLVAFQAQRGSLIYANSKIGLCLRNGHAPTSIVAPEPGIVTKVHVRIGGRYKTGQKMFSYLEIPDCACKSPKMTYYIPAKLEENMIIVSDYAYVTATAYVDPLQISAPIDFYTLLKPLSTLQLINVFLRSFMSTFYAPEDGTLVLSYIKPYIPMAKNVNHLYVYRDRHNDLKYANLDFPLLPCDFPMKPGGKIAKNESLFQYLHLAEPTTQLADDISEIYAHSHAYTYEVLLGRQKYTHLLATRIKADGPGRVVSVHVHENQIIMHPTISVTMMTNAKKLRIYRINPTSIIENVSVRKGQEVAEGGILYTILF